MTNALRKGFASNAIAFLVLQFLVLQKAFHTVNPSILLKKTKNLRDMKEKCKQWFE